MGGLTHQWVHIAYRETSAFTETYGFSGSQGAVNLEGLLISAPGASREVVFLMMHPSSTLQLLPLPPALAAAGYPVLCMGSRYAKNDTALIMEKVGARHGRLRAPRQRGAGLPARGADGLVGRWLAGACSTSRRPSTRRSPSRRPATPVDIVGAGLIPADAVVLEAAHRSRAQCLRDWIDPSVTDEADPDRRDPALRPVCASDLPVRPPYPADWLVVFRAAQLARMRRITAHVKDTLNDLKQRGGAELERGFVTHRTLADPRFPRRLHRPQRTAGGPLLPGRCRKP